MFVSCRLGWRTVGLLSWPPHFGSSHWFDSTGSAVHCSYWWYWMARLVVGCIYGGAGRGSRWTVWNPFSVVDNVRLIRYGQVEFFFVGCANTRDTRDRHFEGQTENMVATICSNCRCLIRIITLAVSESRRQRNTWLITWLIGQLSWLERVENIDEFTREQTSTPVNHDSDIIIIHCVAARSRPAAGIVRRPINRYVSTQVTQVTCTIA